MELKLCYIDDHIDSFLSRSLKSYVEDNTLVYQEFEFQSDTTYVDLLKESKIIDSHILVIDSRLYENHESQGDDVLTGEEFRVILKRVFPYKEVIVVSQNEGLDDNILPKYNPPYFSTDYNSDSLLEDAKRFYGERLFLLINDLVHDLKLANNVLSRIESKGYLDSFLLEEIKDLMDGEMAYSLLSEGDIDKLIQSFKELRDQYNV